MRETWVWSLGWEDPLEKGRVTHSSILAWRSPWTVQSMGSQRVRHDWATFTFPLTLVRFSRVVPGTISGLCFQAARAFKPWPGCSDPARVRHLVSSLEPEPQRMGVRATRWQLAGEPSSSQATWGREFPVLLSLPLHGLPSTLWYYGTLFPVCRQKAGSLIFTDSDTCPAKCTRLESRDGRRQMGRESQDMIPASWGHGVTDWRGRLWDITGFINCHGRITCNLDCQKKKKKNGRCHTFPEKEQFSFLPFKPEPEGFSWRCSVFNLYLPQGLGLGWVQRNSGGKQW